jgi:MSHA biogenesis protein MshJ
MKQQWIRLRDKTDALSLRERVVVFCAIAGALIFLAYSLVLTPLFAREKTLLTQISQQNNNVSGIDAQIVATIEAHAIDPDSANRARLASIKAETQALSNSLMAMQNALVAPEQIVPLLETMLKGHGRLHLLGLTTLPVSAVGDAIEQPATLAAPAASAPLTAVTAVTTAAAASTSATPVTTAAAPALMLTPAKALPMLYRHGVQLAVRGNYLDMVDYMSALEAMPARLIWGKADLTVEDYPNARLSITVYTLSLDKKWMKL